MEIERSSRISSNELVRAGFLNRDCRSTIKVASSIDTIFDTCDSPHFIRRDANIYLPIVGGSIGRGCSYRLALCQLFETFNHMHTPWNVERVSPNVNCLQRS